MSLVTKLMSKQSISVDTAKYGHDSAATIAMESAAELYDIFRSGFYASEQAELGAVSEGVVLESSEYGAVMEGAIKDGISKISQFLKNLWAKVKAFFAEVRKFIDSIVMSGKDFAKKYEVELKKLTNLKDFEYKMYKYDNSFIDTECPKEIQTIIDSAFNEVENSLDTIIGQVEGQSRESVTGNDQDGAQDTTDYSDKIKDFKKLVEDSYKSSIKGIIGTDDEDEVAKKIFAKFRNGAEGEADKEDVKPDVNEIISILKDAKSTAKIDELIRKSDAQYSKAIKLVDGWANKADKMTGVNVKTGSAIAELLRVYSSSISKMQTFTNSMNTAWKSVISERNNAYKSCLMAAMSYDKKESKKDK